MPLFGVEVGEPPMLLLVGVKFGLVPAPLFLDLCISIPGLCWFLLIGEFMFELDIPGPLFMLPPLVIMFGFGRFWVLAWLTRVLFMLLMFFGLLLTWLRLVEPPARGVPGLLAPFISRVKVIAYAFWDRNEFPAMLSSFPFSFGHQSPLSLFC